MDPGDTAISSEVQSLLRSEGCGIYCQTEQAVYWRGSETFVIYVLRSLGKAGTL
jgi:hypothetical protein